MDVNPRADTDRMDTEVGRDEGLSVGSRTRHHPTHAWRRGRRSPMSCGDVLGYRRSALRWQYVLTLVSPDEVGSPPATHSEIWGTSRTRTDLDRTDLDDPRWTASEGVLDAMDGPKGAGLD